MAYISSITLPNGSSYDLKDAIAHAKGPFYGTCETDGSFQGKVITVDSEFSLVEGAVICVLYSETNTAASVMLNVNNSGLVSIGYKGSAFADTTPAICGREDCYVSYVYDGTYWVYLHNNSLPSLDVTNGNLSLIN